MKKSNLIFICAVVLFTVSLALATGPISPRESAIRTSSSSRVTAPSK
jgi:hypothetical protein